MYIRAARLTALRELASHDSQLYERKATFFVAVPVEWPKL